MKVTAIEYQSAARSLPLASPIYHDDRKSLAHWFTSQHAVLVNAAFAEFRSHGTGKDERIRLAVFPPIPFGIFRFHHTQPMYVCGPCYLCAFWLLAHRAGIADSGIPLM
jgi:hypothetical protein